jgi:hypothetical protein
LRVLEFFLLFVFWGGFLPSNFKILTFKNLNMKNLGKHQKKLLDFVNKYSGPHSLTQNKSDPAHKALNRLCKRGLIVKLQIGKTVMAQKVG